MAAPRPPVNGATTSVGFTTKLVTIQAISPDGKTAVAVDRQNTQVSLPMMVQRSKGLLPAVGETWLATQDLGSWTFAAIVANSPSQFQAVTGAQGVYASGTAPGSPSVGELWVNSSLGNVVTVWNGTNWEPLQFGAAAVQPGSLTGTQLSDLANIAASQVNFTASDIGGITTTLSATAPSNPSFGDLWYNAAQGYQLNQWTGVEWTPYQWGTQSISARAVTAELIAANTITAEEMAAGIIYAGIIDGTIVEAATFIGSTFEGSDFILNGSGGYWYTATPGAGNLVVSITAMAGIDPLGNVTEGGITIYEGSARLQLHVNTAVGAPAIEMPTGAASEEISAAFYTWVPAPGTAAEAMVAYWQGPGSTHDNIAPGLYMTSAAANGSSGASGNFVYGSSIIATWDVNGLRSTGSWQNMSLSNGWSVSGTGFAQYKMCLDNSVAVRFGGLTPGTIANATEIWAPPLGFVPGFNGTQSFPISVGYTTAPAYGSTPEVVMRASGGMQCFNLGGTINSIAGSFRYPLD
jgi:hypothetical protein